MGMPNSRMRMGVCVCVCMCVCMCMCMRHPPDIPYANRYTLFGGFSLALGAAVPFIYANPYVFMGLEQLVANLGADYLVSTVGTIEPS